MPLVTLELIPPAMFRTCDLHAEDQTLLEMLSTCPSRKGYLLLYPHIKATLQAWSDSPPVVFPPYHLKHIFQPHINLPDPL